jgi:hypothetical protein
MQNGTWTIQKVRRNHKRSRGAPDVGSGHSDAIPVPPSELWSLIEPFSAFTFVKFAGYRPEVANLCFCRIDIENADRPAF